VRAVDQHLLGVEERDDGGLSFVVAEHLCRGDGRFYGGAALAAAIAGSEHVTGRTALWSTTQLVGTAALGERIELIPKVVASGRSVDQVTVQGVVGDRLVFNAVGGASTPTPDGLTGTGQVMPEVSPPEDSGPWAGPGGFRQGDSRPRNLDVGHHLVSEHRQAELLDPDPTRPGHMALWARLAGDKAPASTELTPAVLGFLADMVPIAVAKACGVPGAGTSLDNSLRLGEPADSEWVLLDLDAHIGVGGYGHGQVHLWSPDGRLLATGTQSCRLFSIESSASARPS
jgi:acyl-CoA thioesterase